MTTSITFENTFAPVPPKPSDLWLNILLDCIAMAAGMVFPPFFENCKGSISFPRILIHGLTL